MNQDKLSALRQLSAQANIAILFSNIPKDPLPLPIDTDSKPKRKISDRRQQWLDYRKRVWEITESQPLHLIKDIEKRSSNYHLDHILPIWQGFLKNIDPIVIGDISNLQILPWKDNLKKSNRYSLPHFTLF